MPGKTLSLCCLLLAAAALAAPAAQATYTIEGEPVAEHTTIDLTGELAFNIPNGLGTFDCEVHLKLTLDPQFTDGEITSYVPTTETCFGTGAFTGCQVTNDATNVPWTATPNTGAEAIVITKPEGSVTFANQFAGCIFGFPGVHLLFSSLVATPDDLEDIEAVTISGTSTTGITVTGELIVSALTNKAGEGFKAKFGIEKEELAG